MIFSQFSEVRILATDFSVTYSSIIIPSLRIRVHWSYPVRIFIMQAIYRSSQLFLLYDSQSITQCYY
jgi:hypothetical protein